MASVNSWLFPGVMHALGWTLIHSLWQCLGVAALAAAVMVFSRRPSIRYLVALSALVAMLALPVATFFLLMRSSAPVHAVLPTSSGGFASAAPAVAALSTRAGSSTIIALEDFPRTLPSPHDVPPNLLPWLVGAWLLGVALFSLRFAGGFLLLDHRRRRQSIAPSPHILALCRELQRQFGLDRAIRYLECSWLQAPAVIGWIRPIVLLPIAALSGLSEDQLRAVIAHELAHIRRFDVFANLFQILVETLLFYHPAIWWLNRRIRAERELCCDEMAVSLTGDRLEYARALTLMAEWKTAPMLAMAANRGPLSERILHILGRKSSGAGPRMAGLTGSILFLAAALGAANTLFGIAYPIPAAHATESLKAALSSGQVAVDHAVRQALQATATDTDAKPDQNGSPETATRIEPPKNVQAEKLVPPSPDLPSLRKEVLITPTLVASNDAPAAPLQPVTHESPVGQVQATLNAPAAMPRLNAGDPPVAGIQTTSTQSGNEIITGLLNIAGQPGSGIASEVYSCHNGSVTGRVMSPAAIQISGFSCVTWRNHGGFGFEGVIVVMNVQFSDAADAARMHPGKLVTLRGDFRLAIKNHNSYLIAMKARYLYGDPFDRDAASAGPASKASPASAVASNDKAVASPQPATQEPPVGAVEAASDAPAATPAQVGSNKLPNTFICHNSSVSGRAISSEGIQMPRFVCFLHGDRLEPDSPTIGSCPSQGSYYPLAQCKFDVTMKVQLADPADASKMQPGKLVRLAGDFHLATGDHVTYLNVTNAKVIWVDPFDRVAATQSALPTGLHDPDALTCDAPQLVTLAKAVGQKICVQNSMAATFGETGALKPGGTVVRSISDLSLSQNPTGKGDPDAVICRQQQQLTGERFNGPIACARNDFWARLDVAGCALDPTARSIIYSGTTKNFTNPSACTRIKGRNGVLPPSFF